MNKMDRILKEALGDRYQPMDVELAAQNITGGECVNLFVAGTGEQVVCAEVVKTTEKAIQIAYWRDGFHNRQRPWIPKSQIQWKDAFLMDGDKPCTFLNGYIPEWLALRTIPQRYWMGEYGFPMEEEVPVN